MNWFKPKGYVLKAKDGRIPSVINVQLIPERTQVIVKNGVVYVDTRNQDHNGFQIFEEGFLTHEYVSPND